MGTNKAQLRQADSIQSSARLLWAFLGALLIAGLGEIFDGARGSLVWPIALVAVLIATSYRQTPFAAAYNGFVIGLFFNFFFSSPTRALTFDSTDDWGVELLSVAVGIAAALLGMWVRGVRQMPQVEPKVTRDEQPQTFLWKSRPTAEPGSKPKEKSWTL